MAGGAKTQNGDTRSMAMDSAQAAVDRSDRAANGSGASHQTLGQPGAPAVEAQQAAPHQRTLRSTGRAPASVVTPADVIVLEDDEYSPRLQPEVANARLQPEIAARPAGSVRMDIAPARPRPAPTASLPGPPGTAVRTNIPAYMPGGQSTLPQPAPASVPTANINRGAGPYSVANPIAGAPGMDGEAPNTLDKMQVDISPALMQMLYMPQRVIQQLALVAAAVQRWQPQVAADRARCPVHGAWVAVPGPHGALVLRPVADWRVLSRDPTTPGEGDVATTRDPSDACDRPTDLAVCLMGVEQDGSGTSGLCVPVSACSARSLQDFTRHQVTTMLCELCAWCLQQGVALCLRPPHLRLTHRGALLQAVHCMRCAWEAAVPAGGPQRVPWPSTHSVWESVQRSMALEYARTQARAARPMVVDQVHALPVPEAWRSASANATLARNADALQRSLLEKAALYCTACEDRARGGLGLIGLASPRGGPGARSERAGPDSDRHTRQDPLPPPPALPSPPPGRPRDRSGTSPPPTVRPRREGTRGRVRSRSASRSRSRDRGRDRAYRGSGRGGARSPPRSRSGSRSRSRGRVRDVKRARRSRSPSRERGRDVPGRPRGVLSPGGRSGPAGGGGRQGGGADSLLRAPGPRRSRSRSRSRSWSRDRGPGAQRGAEGARRRSGWGVAARQGSRSRSRSRRRSRSPSVLGAGGAGGRGRWGAGPAQSSQGRGILRSLKMRANAAPGADSCAGQPGSRGAQRAGEGGMPHPGPVHFRPGQPPAVNFSARAVGGGACFPVGSARAVSALPPHLSHLHLTDDEQLPAPPPPAPPSLAPPDPFSTDSWELPSPGRPHPASIAAYSSGAVQHPGGGPAGREVLTREELCAYAGPLATDRRHSAWERGLRQVQARLIHRLQGVHPALVPLDHLAHPALCSADALRARHGGVLGVFTCAASQPLFHVDSTQQTVRLQPSAVRHVLAALARHPTAPGGGGSSCVMDGGVFDGHGYQPVCLPAPGEESPRDSDPAPHDLVCAVRDWALDPPANTPFQDLPPPSLHRGDSGGSTGLPPHLRGPNAHATTAPHAVQHSLLPAAHASQVPGEGGGPTPLSSHPHAHHPAPSGGPQGPALLPPGFSAGGSQGSAPGLVQTPAALAAATGPQLGAQQGLGLEGRWGVPGAFPATTFHAHHTGGYGPGPAVPAPPAWAQPPDLPPFPAQQDGSGTAGQAQPGPETTPAHPPALQPGPPRSLWPLPAPWLSTSLPGGMPSIIPLPLPPTHGLTGPPPPPLPSPPPPGPPASTPAMHAAPPPLPSDDAEGHSLSCTPPLPPPAAPLPAPAPGDHPVGGSDTGRPLPPSTFTTPGGNPSHGAGTTTTEGLAPNTTTRAGPSAGAQHAPVQRLMPTYCASLMQFLLARLHNAAFWPEDVLPSCPWPPHAPASKQNFLQANRDVFELKEGPQGPGKAARQVLSLTPAGVNLATMQLSAPIRGPTEATGALAASQRPGGGEGTGGWGRTRERVLQAVEGYRAFERLFDPRPIQMGLHPREYQSARDVNAHGEGTGADAPPEPGPDMLARGTSGLPGGGPEQAGGTRGDPGSDMELDTELDRGTVLGDGDGYALPTT